MTYFDKIFPAQIICVSFKKSSGMAIKQATTIPVYRKILKNNDLKNIIY